MKNRVIKFLDSISIARKTAILIAVITAGVLFLGALGHLSLYQLKSKINDLYDVRFQSVMKLDELSNYYTHDFVTIEDKSKKLWRSFKKIDAKLSDENQKSYEILLSDTDKHINAIHKMIITIYDKDKLQAEIDKLNSNFSLLTQMHANSVAKSKIDMNNQYSVTIKLMATLTIFLFLFSMLFTYLIVKNTKSLIHTLSNIVQSKIKDYESLAHNYEDKVTQEVVRNREKDQIMYQHARLAAMGEMIGNIAHQWRQPLNALTILIQSFGTKSMTGKLDQEFIDKQVDEGLRLANQMSNTIEDFRNFFSPTRDREYFSVEQSLNDTLELVEFFCKDEHIDIQVVAKEDLRVFGYSNEFSQVILNLINNARDNFKHKNINDERKIVIKLEKKLKPKQFAMISFTDNGGGIDESIKDRIFEPYFTTKHKSTGTGIGLYMSKQIIEKQMQGLVTMRNIESKLGTDKVYKCAQFIIAIPIK
jgi:signal transduction histidine kinase